MALDAVHYYVFLFAGLLEKANPEDDRHMNITDKTCSLKGQNKNSYV